MAGLCAPLSTLRRHPRGYRRMTRGQCGSLDLHCKRLALSTPCRSSRRTKILDFRTALDGRFPPGEAIRGRSRPSTALDREPTAQTDPKPDLRDLASG